MGKTIIAQQPTVDKLLGKFIMIYVHRPAMLPRRNKFPRLKTVPSGLHTDWQCDLCIMDTIKAHNDGYRYILVCIDVLSRKIFTAESESKKSEHMIEAFEKVFKKAGVLPNKLYSDAGLEFQAKRMIEYWKHKDIIKHIIIRDLNGEDIKGIFYDQELVKTTKKGTYRAEVLKSRTRNGVKEHFVRWVGLSDKYNSWKRRREGTVSSKKPMNKDSLNRFFARYPDNYREQLDEWSVKLSPRCVRSTNKDGRKNYEALQLEYTKKRELREKFEFETDATGREVATTTNNSFSPDEPANPDDQQNTTTTATATSEKPAEQNLAVKDNSIADKGDAGTPASSGLEQSDDAATSTTRVEDGGNLPEAAALTSNNPKIVAKQSTVATERRKEKIIEKLIEEQVDRMVDGTHAQQKMLQEEGKDSENQHRISTYKLIEEVLHGEHGQLMAQQRQSKMAAEFVYNEITQRFGIRNGPRSDRMAPLLRVVNVSGNTGVGHARVMTHVVFNPDNVNWSAFLALQQQQEGSGELQYFVGNKFQRGGGLLQNISRFLDARSHKPVKVCLKGGHFGRDTNA
ncbi:hypothetical protein niasHT_033596 [Heterodera trifolii]|uniref:Integrase catalytic domain-containing protein n=1 Tax=Heterodera trifolii TaxID=157864 RepID=A0ABD2I7Q7_9BILA